MKKPTLTHGDLLRLKRWNTPTVYNGWEQITRGDAAADAFNLEETHDFMPQMGPMVGCCTHGTAGANQPTRKSRVPFSTQPPPMTD